MSIVKSKLLNAFDPKREYLDTVFLFIKGTFIRVNVEDITKFDFYNVESIAVMQAEAIFLMNGNIIKCRDMDYLDQIRDFILNENRTYILLKSSNLDESFEQISMVANNAVSQMSRGK